MKKIYYLLLFVLLPIFSIAQNCVSIAQGGTTYTTKTIFFAVKWNTCNGTSHLYKVWVFVDYCEINAEGTEVGGWQRATVGIPVVTGGPAYAAGNATGFWLTAANNGLTANVKLQIGTGSVSRFKWCAFATDYPPVALVSGNQVNFKGTEPFSITYTNAATQNNLSKNNNTLNQSTALSTITDKTNCPSTTIQCAINAVTLTGAGSYCTSTSSLKTTTNSEMGVTYVLKRDGTIVETKSGTGAVLNFSSVNVNGNYTVVATNIAAGCSTTSNSQAVTVIQPVSTKDAKPNACGCLAAANLAMVGGGGYGAGSNSYTTTAYCRDLNADVASSYTGCGIEIMQYDSKNTVVWGRICDSGWQLPNSKHAYCIVNHASEIGSFASGKYWTDELAGETFVGMDQSYCVYDMWAYTYNPLASSCCTKDRRHREYWICNDYGYQWSQNYGYANIRCVR